MIIDCDGCRARGPACHDCVVTVLLGPADGETAEAGTSGARTAGRPPRPVLVCGPRLGVRNAGAVDLDAAEQAAIAVLSGSGLVPPLRMVPAAAVQADVPADGAVDGDAGTANIDAAAGVATYDDRRGQGTDRAG